ncbi:MAG TPA: helix-turn-helix domain-containing protein [Acetobacteraceae bacterium]|jgi:CRP/FNR family transcriptional regulator, nitrogen fixation regulation protein|nr:helix-turn-helix domain-containing protein [Acetobacteraceae bacterium]
MHASLTLQPTRAIPTVAPHQPATPDALDLLEQFGTTVAVQRDHEIHGQGDTTEYCWRILSGCVRTVKLMEDGRRQVAEFLFPGDLLGLDDLGTHDFAAEAVTDVTLRRYPRRMVESLADSHTALARRLRAMALSNLRNAHDRMVMLGRKTAVEKVASFVLEMQRRAATPGRGVVDVPMSRTDVADHLGLTVETVCRILAHLKREGTVKLHRTGVEVMDPAALRAAACDARH